MSLLTVQDLKLGYGGPPLAEGLSFSVNAGDYLCIVGENGSGKSTLMRTLLGLQPPLAGLVRPGQELPPNAIGYLPQQTPVQRDFPAAVREIVLSGCQARCGWRPFYNKAEKNLAQEAMQRMGILPLAGRCYRTLSGGQQQRVLLARALCAAQQLLLLDEPVAGLDPAASAELYALLASLNREGVAIVMVSHDVSAALRFATHILHMGTPLFFGTREAFLNSEAGKRFLALKDGEPK